jgi:hypothetical protein
MVGTGSPRKETGDEVAAGQNYWRLKLRARPKVGLAAGCLCRLALIAGARHA